MIKSQLGTVQLTRPNYELAKHLNMPLSDVDNVVEAGLLTDLTAILGALADIYGAEHAMQMWTRSVELYIESMKGE